MLNQKEIIIKIAWFLIILGLLILFGYVFGKSIGLIHSPVWVGYIPHMGGGLTLLGIAMQTGKVLQKITRVEKDVGVTDEKVGNLITDVASIKAKVDAHSISIKTADDRIHELSKKEEK